MQTLQVEKAFLSLNHCPFLHSADICGGNVQVLEPKQGHRGEDLPLHRPTHRHPFSASGRSPNPAKRTARHVHPRRHSAQTVFRSFNKPHFAIYFHPIDF